MTPIHHAVDGGHCDLVKILIQEESDLEITDIVSLFVTFILLITLYSVVRSHSISSCCYKKAKRHNILFY